MRKLKKAAVYTALLLTVIAVQNSFLSSLTVFEVRAMIVPVAAAACGFFEDGVWGGFLGLAAGFVCDMGYHENTVLFTVIFAIIGFFSGIASHFFVNGKILPFLFVSAVALLITAGCQMLRSVLFYGAALSSASAVALKQTLLSLPFSALMYAPFRAAARKN